MSPIFVDTHCHLFNIVDVPLYETLIGKVEMGTLKRLAAAFGIGGLITFGKLDNLVEGKEAFIRFFERSIDQNLIWLSKQIRDAIGDSDKRVLVTPLIMDFDCLHETDAELLPGTKVREQLERLVEAITETEDKCRDVVFCPFMGFDLRKLETAGGISEIKSIWNQYGISKADREAGNLATGKVLGIKLYPPIGFNPYPEEDELIAKYNEFYLWCATEKIPVTTHCQNASGSYSVGKRKKEVDRLTNAMNWWRLFDEFPQIRGLTINFAHFGGEDGLEDMIDRYVKSYINEESWTYYLIRLLKKYPNTYADISAFDFTDKGARKNLQTALAWDEQGRFYREGEYGPDGDYKLKDKLLWGSDVPMVISGESFYDPGKSKKKDKGDCEYRHLYKRFTDLIPIHADLTGKNAKSFLMIG